MSLGYGVKILKVDVNGLIAFYKPAGILSHPNSLKDSIQKKRNEFKTQSLVLADYNFEEEHYLIPTENSSDSTERKQLWLVNRLDSATSGIILASTNQSVSKAVKDQFKLRKVTKSYTALVFDTSRTNSSTLKINNKPTFTWKDDAVVLKTNGTIRTRAVKGREKNPNEDIVTAITKTRILQSSSNKTRGGLMLMDMQPLTGYSHQLRYQAAAHNYPIVGDKIYGDFTANKSFQANMRSHPLNNDIEDMSNSTLEVELEHEVEAASSAPVPSDLSSPAAAETQRQSPSRNVFKRLFLHSRKIDLSYEYNGEIFNFTAESPLPDIFKVAMR